MQLNMQVYIDMEREKLRSLDKPTAKKIIFNAENSLLHFLKSKARVNCFRTQENTHPFHIAHSHRILTKPMIFDNRKLEA
jgi:hypothetical protein